MYRARCRARPCPSASRAPASPAVPVASPPGPDPPGSAPHPAARRSPADRAALDRRGRVVESADDVYQRVARPDVRQELPARSGSPPVRGRRAPSTNSTAARRDLPRLVHLHQRSIRLSGTSTTRPGCGPAASRAAPVLHRLARQRVEQRGLARLGQTDDRYFHRFGVVRYRAGEFGVRQSRVRTPVKSEVKRTPART